jgi:acyl-CoA synthetase (AMP-forming)/AMP-acid ligase II
MLVNEFLENSAEKFPEKICLISNGGRFTFREVESMANRLANGFLDLGVGRQDRVAVFLEPSPEAVFSIFAALKAGGLFIVVNPQVKPQKLKYIVDDCQVKLLITDRRRFRAVRGMLVDSPSLRSAVIIDPGKAERQSLSRGVPGISSFSQLIAEQHPGRPAKGCIDIDLASLIYTSGSSGFPKGVMLTHLNMVSAASSIIEYLKNTPEDTIVNVLPLSFDYGLYQVLMAFKFGGTVVQEKSFLYPHKTLSIMVKEKVTGFPIVPAIAAMLFKLRSLKEYNLKYLRYITNTAQALPVSFIRRLQLVFPQAEIYSMYGLTECKRVSYLPPEKINKRPTSVGKAMPNTEAFIVDETGRKVNQAEQIGELVVRGANVMAGYWNLPEETELALRPGLIPGERMLYTGDLFKMDRQGFLYFVSRKDDMIKVAGALVSPREVENALYKIQDVQEAAAIGIKDDFTGQAVKAFVVLKDNSKLKENDILRLLARYLENYMVPRSVDIRKSLPKNAHGKIARKELR